MDQRDDHQRGQHPALLLERDGVQIPVVILDAGGAARFAFEEFFQGQIRNPYTRKAYLHSVHLFSNWCQQRELELIRVTPADVARFLDGLSVASPTRKLHLAALRRFFDALVLRHVLILNPALSVRSERYQVIEGKTPEISIEHARRPLRSIDTSHVVGLRHHALAATRIYRGGLGVFFSQCDRRASYSSSPGFREYWERDCRDSRSNSPGVR